MLMKKNERLGKVLKSMRKDALKAEAELREVLYAVENVLSNKLYRRLDNALNFACFIQEDIDAIQAAIEERERVEFARLERPEDNRKVKIKKPAGKGWKRRGDHWERVVEGSPCHFCGSTEYVEATYQGYPSCLNCGGV